MSTVSSITDSLGIQTTTEATLKSQTKEDNLGLGFEDYLQIIVAQLQNQDMSNPTDMSDFVNQMVQYTTIQAMNEMNTLSKSSYAMSFIGKEVVIAEIDSTGNVSSSKGIVDGVSLYYEEPVFIVDGKEYPMSSIMIAGNPQKEETSEDVESTDDSEV